MMKFSWIKALLLSSLLYASPSQLKAQSSEERFQEMFVTAGYATAFGAAFGAALLAFTPQPSTNLKFIYMGASAGFISGSLMGSYLAFSPVFAQNKNQIHLAGVEFKVKILEF